jgi:hypothetical protein
MFQIMTKSSRSRSPKKHSELRKELDLLREEFTQMHDELVQAVSHDLEQGHIGEKARGGKTAYLALVPRLRKTIQDAVPPKSNVVIVNDEADLLIQHKDRRAQDLSQNEKGADAGSSPGNSAEAIEQVETLRKKGADYLVFPATAFGWLDHYKQLKRYLERRYQTIHRSADTCVIFSLREPSPWREMALVVEKFQKRRRSFPAILDWESGAGLAEKFSECAVFEPLESASDELPYLEKTIDIVAVRSDASQRRSEAHRVATEAIVWVTSRDGDKKKVQLKIESPRTNHTRRK